MNAKKTKKIVVLATGGTIAGLAADATQPQNYTAGQVGVDDLLQGVAQGREHIVLPRRIGWLSKALSLLPARLHDRILLGQPRKPRAGQVGATPIPGLNHPSHKP